MTKSALTKLIATGHIFGLALLTLAVPTYATVDLPESSGITNPVIGGFGNDAEAASNGITFVKYFILLWRALISVGGLAVLIFFLWGALEWIMAGGDTGKMQKAREKITQSVIGLVILVTSFTLIAFISQLFFGENFNLLQLTFPTADTVTSPPGGGGILDGFLGGLK